MRTTQILFIVVILASCAGPSKRNKVTINDVTCIEPPPDVMSSEISAAVDAAISPIKDALRADISVAKKFERIREEIPNLQAVEVLEFRLCAAYANGAIDKDTYKQFISHILPLLKGNSSSSFVGNLEYTTKFKSAINFPGNGLSHWTVQLTNNTDRTMDNIEGEIAFKSWVNKPKYTIVADAGVNFSVLKPKPPAVDNRSQMTLSEALKYQPEQEKYLSESKKIQIKIDNLNPGEKLIIHLLFDSVYESPMFENIYFRSRGSTAIEKGTL